MPEQKINFGGANVNQQTPDDGKITNVDKIQGFHIGDVRDERDNDSKGKNK